MEEPAARHTLDKFEAALCSLRDNVLMMAALTERLLAAAGEALFARSHEAGERAMVYGVSGGEVSIAMLVRFQPMANDLREVVAAMRVGSNLERVADQAVSIARRARRVNESTTLPETAGLRKIFDLAAGIFRDSVRSFAERNEELARTLKERDRTLDARQHEEIRNLTARMAEDTPRIKDYLDLVLIARNIERIGDHATNIAEDAVFAASAEDIRHTAPPAASSTA